MNVKALYIHLMPGFNAFLWVLWYIKLNIVDQLLFCCIIPPFWIWIEMRAGEGHFKVRRGLRGGLSPLTLYSITFTEEVNRSLNARSFRYSVNHRGRVSKAADRYSNTLSHFLVQTSEQLDQVYCAWLKKGLLCLYILYWVSIGLVCLYILEKVEIWLGVNDAWQTHRQQNIGLLSMYKV